MGIKGVEECNEGIEEVYGLREGIDLIGRGSKVGGICGSVKCSGCWRALKAIQIIGSLPDGVMGEDGLMECIKRVREDEENIGEHQWY